MKNYKHIYIPFAFVTMFFMVFLYLQVKSSGREFAPFPRFVLCSANLAAMFFAFLYIAKELKAKVLENESYLIQFRIVVFIIISILVAIVSYLGQSAAASKGLQPYEGQKILYKTFPTIIIPFFEILSLVGVLYWLEVRKLKIVADLRLPFLFIVPLDSSNDKPQEEGKNDLSKKNNLNVVDGKLVYFQKKGAKILPLSDIVQITSDRPTTAKGGKARNLTYIETFGGECLTTRYTLKQFEALLKEHKFFMIHKRHIVNKAHIYNPRVESSDGYYLELLIGGKSKEVPISKDRWLNFKNWFME